ncbi:MAG: tRNA glutamyl-Q(34) synthetase GluQRS [Deltaproteobacteria bacterium]|nr:tRNA glutamyl-Q(34) synthetase GluQRS [Deltaproteobacteria bacterium]
MTAARALRTRFAPSPTGDLHFGGAWTALASWALARAGGGATVLRVEDIDTPRVVRGSAARILEDLAWLGLDFDEVTSPQSERGALYDAALARLAAKGLTYPCDCSRAEIARVASAPHAGEELVYPGTCRDAPPDRPMKRDPAIRLRVPRGAEARVAFVDRLRGHIEQEVDRSVGDFVLRRGDGVYAYQLVVAVDDAEMDISDVVRAEDLLMSTPRQILLMRLLGYEESRVPSYAHVPMVVSADGERLAKRAGAATIRALRERGATAEEIIGRLARGLGLVADGSADLAMTAREVAEHLRPIERWRTTAWPVPPGW